MGDHQTHTGQQGQQQRTKFRLCFLLRWCGSCWKWHPWAQSHHTAGKHLCFCRLSQGIMMLISGLQKEYFSLLQSILDSEIKYAVCKLCRHALLGSSHLQWHGEENEKENTKGLAVSTNSPFCAFPLADSAWGNRELSLMRKVERNKRNVNAAWIRRHAQNYKKSPLREEPQ